MNKLWALIVCLTFILSGCASETTELVEYTEKSLIQRLALDVGITHFDGETIHEMPLSAALDSPSQPVRRVVGKSTSNGSSIYTCEVRGKETREFYYRSLNCEEEYQKILAWQEKSGVRVLYPLIERNEYCVASNDANIWYKTNQKMDPIRIGEDGTPEVLHYDEDLVLEDNYMRDKNGALVMYRRTGSGNGVTWIEVRVYAPAYEQYLEETS